MSSTRRAPRSQRLTRRAETDQLRTARRDALLVLLARAQRRVLSPDEAGLLRTHVDTELAEGDHARASERGQQRAMDRQRQRVEAAEVAIVEAEQRAEQAERQVAILYAVDEGRAHGAQRITTERDEWQQRAEPAEQRVARIRDMADAWKRRLPAVVRTATAADAVRLAADGDYRPVMFPVATTAGAGTVEFAEQERARMERLYTRESSRADQAERERDELHAALGLAPGQLHSAALSAIHGRAANIRELIDRAKQAEADAERYKADALGACRTIADMHEAATGRTGQGPIRGVVEDVADVRARAEQAERRIRILEAVDEGRAHGAQRITKERDAYGHPVEWSIYNAMHVRAIKAEAALDRIEKSSSIPHLRAGYEQQKERAAIYRTAWHSARDRARKRTDDTRANGAGCRAEHERARRAEQALDRVRQADTLGAALAAVAEHDGITPAAAQAAAAFADAADSTEARLAEQAREQAVTLAHADRRVRTYAARLDRVRHLARRMRAGSPQGAAAIYADRIEQALADDPDA
ncbi:hypothetical protein [Streptomyces montanisoli]|uniref:Uncharacterized protein n=1 Tax=Streptomyces montanisoli TaxID=2798581 RepID=A0A940RTL9_9ACTN|nr:hypothetical protein [Streptomyces montanisoli]MBP0456235.1 hypothetical protein [Streptomyces montanisoli]